MGFFHDYNPIWANRITQMMDELCDLLSDFICEWADAKEVVIKETEIYEYANEFLPDLLSDLDEFFNYIHETIRDNAPLDEQIIENYAYTIQKRLHQNTELTQKYHEYSDELTKYEPEVANKKTRERIEKESDYLARIINSDQTFDEDEEESIPRISRAEQFAMARERKQNTASIIIAYLSSRTAPASINLIHREVPGATRQVLEIVRKHPEIIDYKNTFLLGSRLQATPEIRKALKDAVMDTFFFDQVHTCEEIYRQLTKTQSSLLRDLFIDSSYALYSVIHYLFPNDFVFVRPKIGLPGQTITKPIESITTYINGRHKTTLEELKEFIENADYDLTVNLSLINRLPGAIMIDRDTLVPKSKLALSDAELSKIIGLIYEELRNGERNKEMLAIRDLTCVTEFPQTNLKLNEWVLYSILAKYNWPEKDNGLMLYALSTSPYLSRAIPIVSLHQSISKNLRQEIASVHEVNATKEYSLAVDDLNNLDELIEDEIEFDWDLEALEEEENEE